jgi:hydrogenase maturation protease
VLVAGIGSPHGADRLGWAVIDALGERGLPEAVALRACRTPSELTPLLLACSRALVIDALLGDGPAGAIHWLKMADLPGAALRLSSHGVGLVEAVQLAAALGMPEDRLQVLVLDVVLPQSDIQPAWIDALVAQVTAALSPTA